LLDYLVHGKPLVDIKIENLGVRVSPARAYLAAFIVLGMVLIAGLVVGFTTIEEKESRVLRAYAVTPLSIREYFLGKGFFAVGLSFALSFLSAYILLGNQATYGPLFWTVQGRVVMAAFVSIAFRQDDKLG
jgi:ABC-type Na+ efflux pump permease subunit